jgi:hypothetical protein
MVTGDERIRIPGQMWSNDGTDALLSAPSSGGKNPVQRLSPKTGK